MYSKRGNATGNKLTLSLPAVVSGNGYAIIPYLFLAMEEAMGLAWE